MTPKELLKTWLGNNLPSAETLFRSPSYKIPLTWGKQPALLSFTKPVTEILYAVQVAYGTDTVTLGLAKTAECSDFNSLVSARENVSEEIQLAVVEAELQYTLLALSPDANTTPTVQKIIAPNDPQLTAGLPFHLVTEDKEALIASGTILPSTTMINAWSNLDFLAPEDESVITEPTATAHCVALQFDLPEAPEPGDHVILPELKKQDPQDLTVTLVLQNGLRLAARKTGDAQLSITNLLDATPEAQPNAALVQGSATIQYHNLLQLLNGEQDIPVTYTPNLTLWYQGKPAATGILTELAQTPSFEILTVLADER